MSLAIATDFYLASNEERQNMGIHLGSGVSREVWKSNRDGKAYKIPFAFERSDLNLHEAACSAFFRQTFPLPGIIWPDFVCHEVADGVWVSEVTCFVDDATSVSAKTMDWFTTLLSELGIADAAPRRNIFSCNGFIVPIDLGYHALVDSNPWEPKYWFDRKWQADNISIENLRETMIRLTNQRIAGRKNFNPDGGAWDNNGFFVCNCPLCVPQDSVPF